MVKGVNKSIIEVNNTGSEMFEKIVFYVSPKFSSLSSKSLQMATNEIENTLLLSCSSADSLRDRIKYKNKKKRIIVCSSIIFSLCVACFVIFKFIL